MSEEIFLVKVGSIHLPFLEFTLTNFDHGYLGVGVYFANFFAKFGGGKQSAKFAQNLGLWGEFGQILGSGGTFWAIFKRMLAILFNFASVFAHVGSFWP